MLRSRDRFPPGRQSIVKESEYQDKVYLAFLKGEKICVTVKSLGISRSTYYRILAALGITIRPPLHGGNANYNQEQTIDVSSIQSFIASLPALESVRRYDKEHEISSDQRRESLAAGPGRHDDAL